MLKIAVIGCGIAGPAAALFLRQLGAELTVFDKVANLCPVGAGFLLQPAGLDVLHRLGLAQSLIAQGAPIVGLYGRNHRGKVVLDLRYKDLVAHHIGLGMHRAVLYKELMQTMQVQQIRIINPCEIVGIEQALDKVNLKDAANKVYGPYDCVVIADGARSNLRTFVTLKIQVKPYEWGALWAIGRDQQAQFSKVLEQVYKRTEIMSGILPMGYDEAHCLLVSFFWSLKKSSLQHWLDTPFRDWIKYVTSIWPELADLLAQFSSHKDFSFASYYDVRVFPWHKQRVVLIGDAAHGMSPQLGQGANLGLIDAKVLFECCKGADIPTALARYSQERKSQLAYYQQASRFVTPWFQSSAYPMGILRDLVHGLLCKTPIIKQQMLLTLACMKTGYFNAMPLDSFQALFGDQKKPP
ncbi:NAD(P)/FAD-dependent oxidoreductase [Legionella sp. km772]|uniref:FAD-dependent oxidoreductase n=1 Tax=Legionella sp. km772 TaxID=2498111 RepID=UPI0013150D03|nr:NAD(P)/FAD-dependent oxidoreductase [Legionella sp. km772]